MQILPSLSLTTLLALLLSSINPSHAANAAVAVIEGKGIDPSNRPFLTFSSVSGESYEVHRSDDLGTWQSRLTFSGSGSNLTYTDPDPLIDTRFFRVESIQTTSNNLASGAVLTVNQTWSQETNYPRTATVTVPAGAGPHPVLIALHGNGGNSSYANAYAYLNHMIRIGPQGYLNSWNVKNEQSLAPDVDFIRDLILQLRNYDNVDAGRIILLGGSNGAALVNRLLIELNGALFQEAIKLVGQMNASQFHDGVFWHDPNGANAYDTVAEPAPGRRILSVTGTEDIVVPYAGGNGVLGYVFLHAGESIYQWARQMGYDGLQTSEANGVLTDTDIYQYSYLNGDVIMYKLVGGNHQLQPFSTFADGRLRTLIKDFLGHP
ncbi:MAG: hypothetical protein GWO81_06805 [Verrucomicrobia bacterium]|nr:hypothetical protein [Verrucomicrobiota bacterium]